MFAAVLNPQIVPFYMYLCEYARPHVCARACVVLLGNRARKKFCKKLLKNLAGKNKAPIFALSNKET